MATHQDAFAITQYYLENRIFLKPFEPTRTAEFFTEFFWREQVEHNFLEFEHGRSLKLFLFEHQAPDRVIGVANFTHFMRGPTHSCLLGYSLAEANQGKGFMQEALTTAISFIFTNLNFHRITANYMPRNQRSGNLLRKLGFVVEGYARDYILIDGRWEDHILTSLINSNWSDRPINSKSKTHP